MTAQQQSSQPEQQSTPTSDRPDISNAPLEGRKRGKTVKCGDRNISIE